MENVIRRRYLGGVAAVVGGLLAAACGEVEVRYVQGPAGPAGSVGVQGATGATGARGATGAAGEAGKAVVVQKEVPVEKIVEVPAKATGPVKLEYWNGWGPKHRLAFGTDEVIKDFMEKHPTATILMGVNGQGTNATKIKAALAANTQPHIWFKWQVPAAELFALGATLDLNAALKTNKDWGRTSRARRCRPCSMG